MARANLEEKEKDMGRMQSRQRRENGAWKRRRSYRLISVCSATLLAVGLLSAIPVAAGAKRTTFRAPAPPRLALRRWPRARQTFHRGKSTRRAPFLSWSTNKTLSTTSIVNTYTVTTTADTTPAACPATTTEPCTLRQAITQANTDGTLDKVVVPASTSPYLLETDQLTITDPGGVVIAGAGRAKTVIEADSTSSSYPFRVLEINSGANVQISKVTIEDGHSSTATEDGNGGGIEVLSGSLTMRNSTVTANTADGDGGGIYVAGQNSIQSESGGLSGAESQAYLKNVTISDNSASDGGGGLDVEGQAVIGASLVTGNTAPNAGGGILLNDDGDFYPSLSGSDLDVTANTVAAYGGGIANAGSLRLTGGAIGGPSQADGNTAGQDGGGLDNAQVANLAGVAVQNNAAQQDLGGGIYTSDRLSMSRGSLSHNQASAAGGLNNEDQAALTNVKVSGNQAGAAGGLGNDGISLSVTGGSVTGNSAEVGGGVYNNHGTASFNGTSITGNRAAGGGGIYSEDALNLTDVQLGTTKHPNFALQGGGLLTDNLGATIVRSTIEGNRARDGGNGSGGGIFNTDNATDHIIQTTVAGNTSDSVGGGITNYGAEMTIARSTLSGNKVFGGEANLGGGIANMPNSEPESPSNATLDMANDTVTGNRAGFGTQDGVGGGVFNDPGASATLTNVTVSRNRASAYGGGIASAGTAALRGTILAANTAANTPANCDVPVGLQSNGYNLDSDGSCGLNGVGDQTGVNPKLGPLANNGGPTETMALLPGSPAIDAVQACPPPKTDQRNVKRQSPCDIGAYERVPDK
jgi:CSLREA domain-containing protein